MVTDAVRKTVAELAGRNPSVEGSPEAELAIALAGRIDDARNSATSVSMNAGRLLEALAAMRLLAPERPKESPLDEIRARRDKKLAGKPAPKARVAASRRAKPS